MADDANPSLVQQAHLYGAPLGDSVRTVTSTLAISQAAVARTLGISAPMLSQLVSGQRIKLGNPQAVHRLQALLQLAQEVAEGLAHDRIGPRLDQIRDDDSGTLTQPRHVPTDGPDTVSRVLRAVASGQELAAATELLAAHGHPALAEVLRVYGTGRTHDAQRHYAGLAPLLERGPAPTAGTAGG